MSYTLKISDEAEDDIVSAIDYYNENKPGLGAIFKEETYLLLDKIATHPTYYKYLNAKGNEHYRCTRLRKFPFLIIFRIIQDDIIISTVLNTWKMDKYRE